MILTLTPNPSNDSTLHLSSQVVVGGVSRADSVSRVAGGKGVNVSRAVHQAEKATTALFPAAPTDPFIALVRDTGLDFQAVPVEDPIRTNITITDPDGRTTKINGPGPTLSPAQVDELLTAVCEHAPEADAIVLAGSLPPGVPADFYSRALTAMREVVPEALIAVDTSDEPMRQLGKNFATAAPDLIKPNGLELGQLVGGNGEHLEAAAEQGDFSPVIDAGHQVIAQGVRELLITLGAAGAVLVTTKGVWKATPPPVSVRSTVGAGDSSLAGYLLERTAGGTPADCLRRAVAYGTAAAGLPGTTLPGPEHLNLDGTVVTQLEAIDAR